MDPSIFVLFSLALNSLLLTIILLIGWQMFGRPRHAATWAGAYSAATCQWLLNLVSSAMFSGPNAIIYVLSGGLAALFGTLLLLGFRQRAGLQTQVVQLAAGIAILIAALAGLLSLFPGFTLPSAPLLFLLALLLGFSATTMFGRGRSPNPAERIAIVVLLAFALYSSADAAFGLVAFARGMPHEVALYRESLLLVAPAAFLAVGLAAVFLLAADLGETMRQLATIDPLTGVLNRRGFVQATSSAIANCHRQKQPIAVVIADLDRFKALNDEFGHSVGDAALRQFARHCSRTLRVGDPIGRIGGEEFAFLLVNTPEAAAVEVVDRLRASMSTLVVEGAAGTTLSASFGISGVRPEEADPDQALGRADAALYASKQSGRNRVTLATE